MDHVGLIRVSLLTMGVTFYLTLSDLDPVPPEQRTWGAIDYWAYW